MINFICPACGYSREIADRLSGRKWRCPSCNAKIKHRGGDRFQIREVGTLPGEPDDQPEASLDAPPESPDKLAGTRLGPCRLRERLGSGPNGHVYLAEHDGLKRTVAVKVFPPERTQRLAQDAAALTTLDHPNLVRVHEVGVDRGLPYAVLQRVEGSSLAGVRTTEPSWSPERLMKLGRDLLGGLEALHQAKLLHRNLKPGNVLIAPNGDALLADFGWSADPGLPAAGALTETAEYAAPELAMGLPHDVRSDLYSLGGVLHFTVTGRPPFGGSSTADNLKRKLHEPLTPARAFDPQLAPEVDAFLARLLHSEPADRPASAKEAALLLAAPPASVPLPAPAGPTEASAPPPAAPPPARVVLVRTQSTPLVPLLISGGVVMAALAAMLWLGTRPKAESPSAPPPPPSPVKRPLPPPPNPAESGPRMDATEKADLEHLQEVLATAPVTAGIQACAEFLDKHPKSSQVESVLLKKMELHQQLDRLSGKRPAPGDALWTFRLKSGGRIQVPSYQETSDSYVVTLGGTSIRISKVDIDEVVKEAPRDK